MSARNSGQAFDLRCYVRERLIAFLQERFPDSLPKQRSMVARSADQIPADIAAAAAATPPDGAAGPS
jgi:hypothetical protein